MPHKFTLIRATKIPKQKQQVPTAAEYGRKPAAGGDLNGFGCSDEPPCGVGRLQRGTQPGASLFLFF